MRTGTVVIAVVIGVGAGLGRMAHRNGLLASPVPPGSLAPANTAADHRTVLDTVDRASVGSAVDDLHVIDDRVEIHGQTAVVHRTYATDPAAHDTRSFTLQRTEDGSWRIVHVVHHDADIPASPRAADSDG
ncbi:hypothetical protein [Nodularia spumigena]|uniref:hypothetical protein n=1 Tax=Nodularia spumigena TaxID=70799 RepID=UPI002B1EDF82|nr:hypothetical protein [Nodularia spumigena]MEA5614517.1 hypothetical protein [Nodularia spumigena UHCC 0040]